MTSGSDGKLWRVYDAAAAVANGAKRVTGCVSGGRAERVRRGYGAARGHGARRGGHATDGAPPTWIVVGLRAGAGPREPHRVRGY